MSAITGHTSRQTAILHIGMFEAGLASRLHARS